MSETATEQILSETITNQLQEMFSTYVRHMDPNGNCLFEALAWAKKRMELEKEHESGMMKEIDKQAFKSKMKDHINDIRKDCASYFEESMRDFHDLEKGQAENFLQNWQQELRKELSKINSDETQPTANRQLALTHLEYIRNKFQQNRDKLMNLPLLNKMYKTVMTPSEFNRGCLEIPPPWLWGDHIEVWAFANKFKCTIKVIHISKFGTIREDIVEGSDDNKECNLQNRRSIVLVYSESKEHYDMMEVENLHAGMKLDDQSDIFIPKSDDDYSEEETEVHKSDDLTPGEEDRREQQAKKDAKAAKEAARKAAAAKKAEEMKAKAADKKAEEMKAKAEREANAKKRADEKKARQIRETNMNRLLEKFKDECHKQNRLQQDFNKVYFSEVPFNKGRNWSEITSGKLRWQEDELYEEIMAKKESKFGEYGKFDDAEKEMATTLHKWLNSNLETNEREELVWDHFILIADYILGGENTPYTCPRKDENAYEADKQAYVVKYSGDPTHTRKEDRKWLKRFYGILHGQNMVFHANIASSVIEYVEGTVPITGDKQQVDRGIELRKKLFQKIGLQSYPACLPEGFIRDHFKVWSQHAVDIAMSGKAYTVPKYLYDDHEAMAAFTALVNITAKHLRRSRGDAGWVSRTFNGDGRPKTRFKKDPIRWGAQVSTNNQFLVDPSVPAPVLSTALKGSRRWLISENVNW